MRRLLLLLVVLAASVSGVFVPTSATPLPTRSITVAGTEVEMYPAFDAAIERYAVTTTTNTAGSLDVTATTTDPAESVVVDGSRATGDTTTLTGLQAGQQVTVAFVGGASPQTYTLMYLPAGFPKLSVTGGVKTSYPGVAPGLIGLTLNTFTGLPAYDAIVDRNGVPAWAAPATGADLDLKQQPTGDITVSRGPASTGRTGAAQTTLDPLDGFAETARQEVRSPLTNTDGHDSETLPDGSTILIGYELNGTTGKTDATVQKIAADGTKVFEWTSADYVDESMASPTVQNQFVPGDYAHVNSVESIEHGDLLVSFRHLSSVYRIATVAHDGYLPGDVIWRLGGRHSSFTFPDDPDVTGPCAQHDATELPNGHILLFDNGTNGLCVDPADPVNGAGVNRNYTRVKEYALDTTAHTASLVWSYPDDTSKNAFFAGSASRLANGNTLIGWAADTNALVTEVNNNKDNLWELTTPATSPRYMTYRAALITGPQLTMTGPADGSTLVRGDAVAASGTCTAWVPGLTTACATSGLGGGRLDTTSVGRHTWSVTADDGTGNTWTKTRSYTVRAPNRLPDGLLRKAASPWRGNDVYGAATRQSVRERVRRTHTSAWRWRVQNDGERADGFRLKGTGSNRRFQVRYLSDGVDVTHAVVAGTFRTATLQPGQSATLLVKVTPTRRAPSGRTHSVTMRATSLGDATRTDRVAALVTARR